MLESKYSFEPKANPPLEWFHGRASCRLRDEWGHKVVVLHSWFDKVTFSCANWLCLKLCFATAFGGVFCPWEAPNRHFQSSSSNSWGVLFEGLSTPRYPEHVGGPEKASEIQHFGFLTWQFFSEFPIDSPISHWPAPYFLSQNTLQSHMCFHHFPSISRLKLWLSQVSHPWEGQFQVTRQSFFIFSFQAPHNLHI